MRTDVRVNHIACQQGEHSHGFSQILFGYRGLVECELGKGGYYLDADHALLVPPDSAHAYLGRDVTSQLIVVDIPSPGAMIQACNLDHGVDLNGLLTEKPVYHEINGFVRGVLDSVQQCHDDWQRCSSLMRNQTALLLITGFLGNELNQLSSKSRSSGSSVINEDRINAWIDQRLDHPPSLEELAHWLNMSVSRATAAFNDRFNVPPKRYIMARRMMWAKVLIQSRGYSLAQVAYELGFSSQSVFTRAFTNHFGHSPGQLRKEADH